MAASSRKDRGFLRIHYQLILNSIGISVAVGTRNLDLERLVLKYKREQKISWGEMMIWAILLELQLPVHREFSVIVPKYGQRRFDFWLEDGTCIEYHGKQHFDEQAYRNGFGGTQKAFRAYRGADKAKYRFGVAHGWKMIYLDYTWTNLPRIRSFLVSAISSADRIHLSDPKLFAYLKRAPSKASFGFKRVHGAIRH